MRFEDERYVRLFTRDTVAWVMAPWEAKCVLPLILRKLDRAGLLELDDAGVAGLAAIIQVPLEVVRPGLKHWLDAGSFRLVNGTLVMPKFMEAQEITKSSADRKREQRQREREAKMQPPDVTRGHAPSRSVTDVTDVTPVTDPSRNVTPCLTTLPSLPSVPVPVTRLRDFGDEPDEAEGSDFSAELASQTRMRAEPAARPSAPSSTPPAEDVPGSVAPFASSTFELALGEAYAEAAAKAQKTTGFVLDAGGRRLVRETVNTFCPPGLPLADVQKRIRSSVKRYVADRPESKYENGWHPRKWQTWVNGGHGATLAKPPAKTVEEMDAEYHAAEEARLAKLASEARPPDPEILEAILGTVRRMASGDTSDPTEPYWLRTLNVARVQ